MGRQSQSPSYDVVIPAPVRYSDISMGAKILYGEIRALCNKEGYCWATNGHFADIYDCSKRTIRNWLKELKDIEQVYVEIDDSREKQRRIYLTPAGGREKSSTTPGKNLPPSNDTSINSTSNKLEGEARSGEKRRGAEPPEESDMPSPASNKHQASSDIRSLDGVAERDKYLTILFGQSFETDPSKFFDHHGRLASIRSRVDQAGEDGHEWLVKHIFKLKQKDEFDPRGPSDYQKRLPTRALNYLSKIAPSQKDLVPQKGEEYSQEEVERFRWLLGRDNDIEWEGSLEKVGLDTWKYFEDDE